MLGTIPEGFPTTSLQSMIFKINEVEQLVCLFWFAQSKGDVSLNLIERLSFIISDTVLFHRLAKQVS